MSKEFYEDGKPLSREGLFQLITDEVLKDGVVENWEDSMLRTWCRLLRVAPETAKQIFHRSKEKYKSGELGRERPFHVATLYERTLYFIVSDKRFDDAEKQMLKMLRRLFNVDDEKHKELYERVRAKEYETSIC